MLNVRALNEKDEIPDPVAVRSTYIFPVDLNDDWIAAD